MPFQPEDIARKQFLVRARGYDRDEVAAFLRAVAVDYDQALEDRAPTDATAERETARLLADVSRRLEAVAKREHAVAEREGAVAEAELHIARQLRAVHELLDDVGLATTA